MIIDIRKTKQNQTDIFWDHTSDAHDTLQQHAQAEAVSPSLTKTSDFDRHSSRTTISKDQLR